MTFFGVSPSQLWMGSIEPHMTSGFIMRCFESLGENPTHVKMLKDRQSWRAEYCFVHFKTEDEAKEAFHRLNGKVMPNTSPPVKFNLKFTPQSCSPNNKEGYSLHVRHLNVNVDDFQLYRCFSSKYRSLRSAKVVKTPNGLSRGFGFINFSVEADQQKCLKEMNGVLTALSSMPIKLSLAVRNRTPTTVSNNSTSGAFQESDLAPTPKRNFRRIGNADLWHSYAWQNHCHQSRNTTAACPTPQSFEGKNSLELIGPTRQLAVQDMNQAVLDRDIDFWDAIESSKWSPIDSSSGYIDACIQF